MIWRSSSGSAWELRNRLPRQHRTWKHDFSSRTSPVASRSLQREDFGPATGDCFSSTPHRQALEHSPPDIPHLWGHLGVPGRCVPNPSTNALHRAQVRRKVRQWAGERAAQTMA